MAPKPDAARTRLDRGAPDFLAGGGDLGALIRAKDWADTSLGPPETWPQSLRTAVNLCLASNFPINIIWGKQHTQIYNDGYRVCCGDAHPRALGEDYRVTWASAWPVIGESFERALAGDTMYLENQRMFLKRLGGALEETFFTFSHSPIRDESGGIGGLFHPVTETTATMLAERRNRALRDLGAGLAGAAGEAELARTAVGILSRFDFDLPFVLYYVLDPTAAEYRLTAHCGLPAVVPGAPAALATDASAPWPVAEAIGGSQPRPVSGIGRLFGGQPCGPYDEPPQTAFVVPISVPASGQPPGVIIAGASARLKLTDDYQGFYALLGATISAALATVRAREDERRRSEALAEIDRAKTAFFSNVSHEFRTPLTLMLGPLEDVLNNAEGSAVASAQRQQLDLVHRNSLRLLKLVNALLDFSRIEAGRVQASYRPCELAELTGELASGFRSAIERAGLFLTVDCRPLPAPVFVDREMWEKIVLNLLSNAFKFTFAGGITVSVQSEGDQAVCTVSDTGEGIPPQELSRLFERFHRIQGQRSRSFEGSGIGLALVHELVRLHGGSITVQSEPGRGTTFTVCLPFGSAHLPANRVNAAATHGSPAVRIEGFVADALNWLPDLHQGVMEPRAEADAPSGLRPRVLLADDNADMRAYLRRLLSRDYEVTVVADGMAAWEAMRQTRPDLLVTDVMMPLLDGFELLKKIRADPALRDVSVILLSARAGEEARVEGLNAGADDYVVKPFAARELLARLRTNLGLGAQRRQLARAAAERAARLAALFEQAPGFMCVQRGPEHVYELANEAYFRLVGRRDLIGRSVRDALPELVGQPYFGLLDQVYRSGVAHKQKDARVLLRRTGNCPVGDGPLDEVFVEFVYQPITDADGTVTGIFTEGFEVTERRAAEAVMQEHEERLRLATEAAEIGLWDVDPVNDVLLWPPRVKAMFGISAGAAVSMADYYAGLHPEDRAATIAAYAAACDPDRRAMYDVEYRTVGKEDGVIRWVAAKGRGVFDAAGECIRVIGTAIDISERKKIETELRRLNEDLEARVTEEVGARHEVQERLAHAQRMEALGQLAGGIAHDFNNVLQAVIGGLSLIERRWDKPQSVQSLAHMAFEAAERGKAITDRLLTFARRGELRSVAVEPGPFLEALKEMLGSTLCAGITVRTETAADTPALLADKAQLDTVLINLAVNARDAMPAGGELVLSANPVRVTGVGLRPGGLAPGSYVRLDVADTGVGMDAETRARASEPFFTTKAVGQGTGLGLPMARGFAEQSGGALAIQSVPGNGTTISLWFPQAPRGTQGNTRSETRPGAAAERPARTLVVDDDPLVRAVLVEQIRALGHEVVEASDGLAALALLDDGETPDLLVTDFSMPGMNGLLLIDEARRRMAEVPAVLLTGYADQGTVRELEKAQDSRTALLRKPITSDALADRMAALLGDRTAAAT